MLTYADNGSMALKTFLITISNTEDLALLGRIQLDTDIVEQNGGDFSKVFKHEFRALFNEPMLAELATEFAEKTVELDNEVSTDPAELAEISDAQQS